MKLSAAIFDLDGTVLANEDKYAKAFKKVLEKLGVNVSAKYPHMSGIGVEENWPGLIKKYNIKTDKAKEELAQETQSEYYKLLNEVSLQKGFEDFVNQLKEDGVRVALATSNTWSVVEKIFDYLPIEKYFDSVTTGEEVDSKKPAPDLFITAAGKLNAKPEECIVFEDSVVGVKAARTAGMKVVGIARDDKYAEKLKDADLVIENYFQLVTGDIANSK